MIVRVICAFVVLVAVLDAVPSDYVLKAWTKNGLDSRRIESRLGAKTPKTKADTEETTDDDDLNRLLNNFWAVDNLPKQSPYVTVKKLPDVYLDQNDLPCPMSDMMPVEMTEITKQRKVVNPPVFNSPIPTMGKVDNRNYQQYANYMPYPPYPVDAILTYEDVNFYGDNNTQYPQEEEEVEIGTCPNPNFLVKKEEPEIHNVTSSSTEQPMSGNVTTVSTETVYLTTSDVQKENTTTQIVQEVTSPKINNVNFQNATTQLSNSTEKVTTTPTHLDYVMKISNAQHKSEKRKKH